MYRIYLLFFMSGIAGLVYQVVWSRLLHEIFGVTVYAVTTVLATFLAGLALGALVLGRVADRMRSPLAFYGWLEVGSGLAAFAGTWVVRGLDPLHIWAANRFAPDSAALIGARVLLGALVILPPTFLMGGTLPAITRFFVHRIRRLGRELSFLYALNTLGAVCGTLLSAFVLIRLIGLHPTLWLAVAINLFVGALAILWAARFPAAIARDEEPAGDAGEVQSAQLPGATDTGEALPAGEARRATGIGLLVVMAVCGFASLGLEVVWARMLILVVGTTTYAFATMLASFLVGITAGSFIARGIVDRLRSPRAMLGWVQVGIALTTLATLPLLGHVSETLGPRLLGGTEQSWAGMIMTRFGISFLIMLVPTTLIGMTFPLAGKIWAREVRRLGGSLGEVYGANTLGNILGAAVTGFVILPAAGLQKSVVIMAALSLGNAAWALAPGARSRALAWVPRVAVLAGGVLVLAVGLFVWKPPALIGGTFESREILFYEECLVATTMVYRDKNDPRKQSMAVDRIKIGDSFGDVDMKQQGLAHFPFLLRPDRPPATVLSIGLGTGILIGEAVNHPSVKSLECVEIAPSVIAGSRLFDGFNGHVMDNPRVTVICDDGVNFLRRSSRRYDAIMSDAKSRTSHSGNSLFLSRDYHQLCHDRLMPDGLMIEWVPLNAPPEELPVILRTFASVFPYTYVWVDPPGSCYLVGLKQPLVLDVAHIQSVLDAPPAAHLRRYGWRNAYGFISQLCGDQQSLASWLHPRVPLNTLEHPILEFYSLKAFAEPEPLRMADNLAHLAQVRVSPPPSVTLAGADPAELARHAEAASRFLEAQRLLQRGAAPDTTAALQLIAAAIETAPTHGRIQYTGSNDYMNVAGRRAARGDGAGAVDLLQRAVAAEPDAAEAHFNLGNAMAASGRQGEAEIHFRRVVELVPEFGGGHFNLANVLATRGAYAEAALHFRKTLELRPDFAPARERLQRVMQLQRQGPARGGS